MTNTSLYYSTNPGNINIKYSKLINTSKRKNGYTRVLFTTQKYNYVELLKHMGHILNCYR